MRAGGSDPKPTPVQTEESLAKQNQASMRELQNMMGGLGT